VKEKTNRLQMRSCGLPVLIGYMHICGSKLKRPFNWNIHSGSLNMERQEQFCPQLSGIPPSQSHRY